MLNSRQRRLPARRAVPDDDDPAGRFQPLALIVPFANGTMPAPPAGFAGPSHMLPPIVGDKRVALTKKHLTFFHGAHFYIPLAAPAPSGGSLFPGESWAETVALDVELPVGCELVGAAHELYNVTTLPGATSHGPESHSDAAQYIYMYCIYFP